MQPFQLSLLATNFFVYSEQATYRAIELAKQPLETLHPVMNE